jgi:hypothetical protein
MAGKVVVSTLNDDTGVLATQNGMTGICKAWVNFNGTGTVAIRDSFNVSSITDNGTGDYTVNFTTAMPNANYSLVTMSNKSGTGDAIRCCNFITDLANPATGSCRISHAFVTGTPIDSSIITVAVFSS